MKRYAAGLWLAIVLVAAVHLGVRLPAGDGFQTDLMALLPQEERDPAAQDAKQRIAASFGQRIFLLVGHRDRLLARRSASELAQGLSAAGFAESVSYQVEPDAQRRLAAAFFPYRQGLLAAADRTRLEEDRGQEVVKRALSSVYGLIGVADATLLRNDPFLLLPAFFTELPLPLARIAPDEGLLSVRDGGKIYVFVTAKLAGEVFSLRFQDRFAAWFAGAERRLEAEAPGLEILRTGSLFYAHDAATDAFGESSTIGAVSLIGTALLILFVFRALQPLWLSILAIAVGILCAYSATLALFRQIHVGALLFGASLIGVAVDYSLIYCAQRFDRKTTSADHRLRHVLPGIALGLATTVIGYVTLLLAPFPGLHQVAAFSVIGLTASFLTVVLWAPALDRTPPLRHGGRLLAAADWLWRFWQEAPYRRARGRLIGLIGVATVLGLALLGIDDDVRRLQPLSPELKRQEHEIQRLTGVTPGGHFLLIQAPNDEAALRLEEAVLPRLEKARREGSLTGYQALAQFMPSMARQEENRRLVRERLVGPYLTAYYDQLGLIRAPAAGAEERGFLEPAAIAGEPALWFLRNLMIEGGGPGVSHVVLLNGVSRAAELQRLGDGLAGVRFVDPTGDVSRLLGQYRFRAVGLLALSAVLMLPLMAWRYGAIGSLRVAFPSLVAVLLAPALTSLLGLTFTFFNAMALVMVLSIGIDYAIFCRESATDRRTATLLGVSLAMLTTILSFGLLALSSVAAVRGFGLTMLFGIPTAFLLAPWAASPDKVRLGKD